MLRVCLLSLVTLLACARTYEDKPAAPQALEPEVVAFEGGTATLRCLHHGNPAPKVTWRFRGHIIDSNANRYRLISDGALEINSLYRNDTGVYICVADNGLGVATQEVHLVVNGFQTRNVTCRSREELEIVDASLCDDGLRPPTNQSCSPDPCLAQWVEGPWGECSQRRGSGGVKSREVTCQKIIANGIKSVVPDKECFDLLGPKPEVFQKCNEDALSPTWFIGRWKPCNKLCDKGKQTRLVLCYQKKNGSFEELDDENCTEEKPEEEQPCMVRPCDAVDWVTTSWSECDTCSSKFRTRTVMCATKSWQMLNESFCSHFKRPADHEECHKDVLPACRVNWYATEWSKCSVNCGDGVHTRKVFCGMYYDDKSGQGVKVVEDAMCANLTKYNDTKPCTVPKEQCPSQWFAGPWSVCSERCGGGQQYRRVMCFQGDKEATDCDDTTVLESMQFCNTGPCHPDLVRMPARIDGDENATVTGEQDSRLHVRCLAYGHPPPCVFWYRDDEEAMALYNDTKYEVRGNELIFRSLSIDSLGPYTCRAYNGVSKVASWELVVRAYKLEGQFSDNKWLVPRTKTQPPINATTITPTTIEVPKLLFTETSTAGGLTETTEKITESFETSERSKTNEDTTDVIGTTTLDPCSSFEFGCCADNETEASGLNGQGCPCNAKEFGSCSDDPVRMPARIDGDENATVTGEQDSRLHVRCLAYGHPPPCVFWYRDDEEAMALYNDTEYEVRGNELIFRSLSIDSLGPYTCRAYNGVSKVASWELVVRAYKLEGQFSDNKWLVPRTKTQPPINATTITPTTIEVPKLLFTETSTAGGLTETTEKITESFETSERSKTNEDTTDVIGTTTQDPCSSFEFGCCADNETEASGLNGQGCPCNATEFGSCSDDPVRMPARIDGDENATVTGEQDSRLHVRCLAYGHPPPCVFWYRDDEEAMALHNDAEYEVRGNELIFRSLSIDSLGPYTCRAYNGVSKVASWELVVRAYKLEGQFSDNKWLVPRTKTQPPINATTITPTTIEVPKLLFTETSTAGGLTETTEKITESFETSERSKTNEDTTDVIGTTTLDPCSSFEFGCCADNETEASGLNGQGCPCNAKEFGSCSDDPVRMPARIDGDENATVTGEQDSRLHVRCLAYGHPPPCVFWYRDDEEAMALYNDTEYEVRGNELIFRSLSMDSLGPYTCRAYNGVSKVASWELVVRAYKLEGQFSDNKWLVPRTKTQPPINATTITPTTIEGPKLLFTETSTAGGLTETTGKTPESFETSERSTTNEDTTDVIGTTTLDPCSGFEFGCCADNETEASGPDGQGCPCNATEFGCCPDGLSPATGRDIEDCTSPCSTSPHGCCQDDNTPAHGPDLEGCCLLAAFGCCPDNRKPAKGPHLEGCACQYALHGCCPDNVTIAQGADNQGCGCQYTQHGCCPDRHTTASGPNNEGCACNTYQFGCCADGVTIAKGPEQQGCHCHESKFDCCGDGETHATGPDAAGCDCSSSRHGCCPDGRTEATGPKFFGCSNAPENKQAACSLPTNPGPCHNFTATWYYDLEYGGCSRFWYGGCDGNGNRFVTKEECEDVCIQPSPKDVCKLPSSKGACDSDYQRWHYNSTRELCIPFRYGGCLGNANNFNTRELCQKQCEPSSVADQCYLPIDQGSCAGNYSRWGFNSVARRCEQFVWGGCEGNSNRFSTEAACQMRCAGSEAPQCTQPQEAGNCTEKEALWSFSQSENRCLPFYYSGCGGNDNQFRSRETCEQTCPSAYDVPAAPQALPQQELEVSASEGGTATLRCLFHGNPPPEITWRFGELFIDENAGRYRLMSDGALEIVSLYRNDTGVYICVAYNGLGVATQKIHLAVNDPVRLPVGIAGEENATVTGELCSPLHVRCLAYGYPPPSVYWYRGYESVMVPYSDAVYEARGNVLLIRSLALETLGQYTCQAYNGEGKAASWVVFVRAYMPEGLFFDKELFVPRNTVVPRPRIQPPTTAETTTTTTSTTTETLRPFVTDPMRMAVGIAGDEKSEMTGELDSPLMLHCRSYGDPPPNMSWYHGYEGTMLLLNDTVYEPRGNFLLIRNLTIDTLGRYTCQATYGEGRVASRGLVVRAYMPKGLYMDNKWLVPRDPIVSSFVMQLPITTVTTTTTTTTTEAPTLLYIVPVSTHVSTPSPTLNIGTDLHLTCEVDGYPEPDVHWTKDGSTIEIDGRITITGSTIVSRLTVMRVTVADSGLYACHASNPYSWHSDTAQINVRQIMVPAKCTDNPFFVNCELIVRSRFCRQIYYSKFCCKSCVEAGQLDPQKAELLAD